MNEAEHLPVYLDVSGMSAGSSSKQQASTPESSPLLPPPSSKMACYRQEEQEGLRREDTLSDLEYQVINIRVDMLLLGTEIIRYIYIRFVNKSTRAKNSGSLRKKGSFSSSPLQHFGYTLLYTL